MADEAGRVGSELSEIELLVSQARTEAARHETRRQAAAEKLAIAAGATNKELTDQANHLMGLARKSALMEAQIDLLEGKRKSTGRLRDALAKYADELAAAARSSGSGSAAAAGSGNGNGHGTSAHGEGVLGSLGDFTETDTLPPAVARLVHAAQEDLRREIARAMHDGPAQSLTNIVLQAQIVEHLLAKDPDAATAEVHALTAMVQKTLDATKTFIFDVRPMVLDDLGLVPTLRRACRDRGARVRVKVEFESVGVDRRLPVELESGLFRMLDDALGAQVAAHPERVAMRLDWGEELTVDLEAWRAMRQVEQPELPAEGEELPPALAGMVEERRAAYQAELEAARVEALSRLPERVWREIADRSALLGIRAELLDDGARLHLTVPLETA